MFYFILFLALQIVLFGAWVSGTLDPYQKKFQEIILEAMGETKVSYGLKSVYIPGQQREHAFVAITIETWKANRVANVDVYLESLTGKKLIEDENFSKIQDALSNQIGGVFGKGGLGDGLGTMLSKGL